MVDNVFALTNEGHRQGVQLGKGPYTWLIGESAMERGNPCWISLNCPHTCDYYFLAVDIPKYMPYEYLSFYACSLHAKMLLEIGQELQLS